DYNNAEGKLAFLVSVTFEYDDRPDSFSEYRPGFEIRTRKRCIRIEIHTHAEKELLTRSYEVTYLDQRNDIPDLANILPLSGVSLLNQIRVLGHDDEQPIETDRTEELPPLEFGHTRFELNRPKFFPITGPQLPPVSLANPDFELVDLIGNGLPDIFQM